MGRDRSFFMAWGSGGFRGGSHGFLKYGGGGGGSAVTDKH